MPPRTGTGKRRVPAPKPPKPSSSSDGDEASSDPSLDIEGNDPDAIPTKTRGSADDVNFFFDKTGDLVVCRECR